MSVENEKFKIFVLEKETKYLRKWGKSVGQC